MWKALPFSNKDEDSFRTHGYSEEFIRWMRRKHDADTRILLISENITNAAKLGRRIRWHFESNPLYRGLFPETLPDSSCKWTDFSLAVKRSAQTTGGAHGEGTFDFLGVGSALQSRHYTGGMVEDDLVGRKAIESASIMDSTIGYHQLLVGAFEDLDPNHELDELIVGNRWAFHDLNSYVKEEEDWFEFHTHSALGGCCELHPIDTPIFPEEFSHQKLLRLKKRLGNYLFSCQYLNNPSSPEDADFKETDLNFYAYDVRQDGKWIENEVKDGVVRPDIKVSGLSKCIVTDPAHSGNAGTRRCRHAICVVGYSASGNLYLLDTWAEACNYDKYFDKLYQMAKDWQVRKVGFETVAAQKFAAYHIGYRNQTQDWKITIVPLKGEVEGIDGAITRKKEWRIRTIIAPILESGRLFIQRKQSDFIGELCTFPMGRYCDQLDAFAYAPQVLRRPLSMEDEMSMLAANEERAREVNRPYSLAVN